MRIILLIFFLISFTNLNAQKYTEQYIQEANVIGLNWWEDFNNKNYIDSYNSLDISLKERFSIDSWENQVNDRGSDLYSFWGDMVKNSLLSEMNKDECLINLASNEYSKVLSLKSFDRKVITPVFKDFKNGQLKVISFFAKRARGEMANFILSNRIVQVSDLKNFEYDGYRYSDEINNQLLFTR